MCYVLSACTKSTSRYMNDCAFRAHDLLQLDGLTEESELLGLNPYTRG